MAGLAAACSPAETDGQVALPDATEIPPTAPPVADTPTTTAPAIETLAFFGEHQSGVLRPTAPAGIVATFDVLVSDRSELALTMQALSVEVQRLTENQPSVEADGFLPPVDSGAVDAATGTAGLSITVAVGASLFDQRFGLASERPRELIAMPRFFNDRLVREDLSHGDLSVTIAGPNSQAAVFALHQLVRVTERQLRLRWVQEGYNQILPPAPGQVAQTRNLMGFRDGTSNLDAADADTMREFVWVQPDDGEPEWAVGGTYQAARVIRMLIEFWATAALVRQEQIFGRHRDTGAPIGQTAEADEPAFASDPGDDVIPARAHMRLANPRTPDTGRILRRGFSYLNGAAVDGTLDQGLLFLCYQRSLQRGFLEVQARLDGEPLEDYIKPVGGGIFFVLPGPGADGWLGETLLG
jgi:deferrochelatase/peroxidase EfeB